MRSRGLRRVLRPSMCTADLSRNATHDATDANPGVRSVLCSEGAAWAVSLLEQGRHVTQDAFCVNAPQSLRQTQRRCKYSAYGRGTILYLCRTYVLARLNKCEVLHAHVTSSVLNVEAPVAFGEILTSSKRPRAHAETWRRFPMSAGRGVLTTENAPSSRQQNTRLDLRVNFGGGFLGVWISHPDSWGLDFPP